MLPFGTMHVMLHSRLVASNWALQSVPRMIHSFLFRLFHLTGLPNGKVTSLIANDTHWCIVDPSSCKWPQHMDGFPVDTCIPEVGRVTNSGGRCQLPADYHNITLYDCVGYNHSALGSTVEPWCFTDATAGEQSCLGFNAACLPLSLCSCHSDSLKCIPRLWRLHLDAAFRASGVGVPYALLC